MSQISIKERTDRMIAKDAILLNLYTCKGRNYSCECNDCYVLCNLTKKKIDWKTIIHMNGNIKGGKSFIRRELPKFAHDKKILTKFKQREEEYQRLKMNNSIIRAEQERKEKEITRRFLEIAKTKREIEEADKIVMEGKGDLNDLLKNPSFALLHQEIINKQELDRRIHELSNGLPPSQGHYKTTYEGLTSVSATIDALKKEQGITT